MRPRWMAAAGLAALAATACSGDPSDVTAEELVGLWGVISLVYTSQADPSVRADLVAAGAIYSLRLVSGGTYESRLSGPSVAMDVESGEYDVRGRMLLLTPAGRAQRSLTLRFNESLLTLHEADTAWDFDGDGSAEAAALDMVLDRF
ncbi:MAG TPA: hypothetical protein VMM12_04545 [Longimicrobiales bacterium]|nr:hypothetical protein [Longimicrobiales bacterium]